MNAGNGFFFAAGVLAVIALLFVLYPWLAGQPRAGLLAAMPRWVPLAGAAAIIVVLALYIRLGSPQLNDRDATADRAGAMAGAPAAGMGGNSPSAAPAAAGSMDSAIAGLEHRLAAGGGNDGDWELLAKSYEFLGRPADAAAARQKRLPAGAGTGTAAGGGMGMAVAPAPAPLSAEARAQVAAAEEARGKRDFAKARSIYAALAARNEMDADAWANYADVAGALNNNSLAGEPATYIGNALRLDPQHAKALWLKASLEHETRQYAAAVGTWQQLITVLGPSSSETKLIAANLAEDQRLAGVQAPGSSAGATAGAAAAGSASGVSVRGEVDVADALKGRIPAGLTLFIVAKSVASPGPPVAILRTTTGTWPLQFQLDDSQAMLPTRRLSTAGTVTIEARTSRTGQAMPAAGDFQGVTAPIDPSAAKPVRVVIQRVIG
jgi:cytochrome c-type biogenesis protein CcmH/NrfG